MRSEAGVARGLRAGRVAVHAALIFYALLAVSPILLILINSFKSRNAIFGSPLSLPNAETFSLVGYTSVLVKSNFPLYYANSLIVTVGSLVLTLVLGAMASWALTEYRFRFNAWLGLYMAIGIMVPIRLGTVSILKMMVSLDLVNTLTALVLVYTAMSLPLAIFILSEFIQQIPREMRDAARIDGASEYSIFWRIIFPLIRPAVATVAVFTMVPIWNDLWFPLILAPGATTQTVTLGVQQFIGQYVTDWNAVIAALSLALAPILVLYIIFSRSLVRGITAGAVK
jgi:raffinose/stachyose/melibiose transport system permease protein